MEMTKELGKRIQEYRVKNNLSQEKFADLVNCSWLTIQRWQKGSTGISPMAYDKLIRILDGDDKK